jgi:hypothetical protein
MIRRLSLIAAAVVLGVALVSSFTDVTFVMRNGERISGTFVYHHTDHYNLIVNGQERSYPSDDIAMIQFAPGDPTPAEIAGLPAMDNGPELERHTAVMRSGEIVRGKIWDFQDDKVIMDIQPGDRRTFTMNNIARLYINAGAAHNVFKDIGQAANAQSLPGRGSRLTVQVPANRAWTDTGVVVNQGDRVTFMATGQIHYTGADLAGPDGVPVPVLSNRRRYPLPTAGVGALIGRIGDGAPFVIGNNTQPIVMPVAGQLALGVNDDGLDDNSGAFTVRIQR